MGQSPALSLDYSAQTPTWRQFTPYGAPRGTVGTWLDDRGFLNAPNDTTTGLTTLGARDYDPNTGSFISLDPLLAPGDTQQLNGYAYSDNDPVNRSDPSGLIPLGPTDGGTSEDYQWSLGRTDQGSSVYQAGSQYVSDPAGGWAWKDVRHVGGYAGISSGAITQYIPSTRGYESGEYRGTVLQAHHGSIDKWAAKHPLLTHWLTDSINTLASVFITHGEAPESNGKPPVGAAAAKSASSVSETYTYNMVDNPGPLAEISESAAAAFAGGQYNIRVLTQDTVLYRGGVGTPGKEFGSWFTAEPPASVANVRIDTAVRPHWYDLDGGWTGSSPIDTVYSIRFPAGTTIYEGPVANQGGVYVGGAQQIYIQAPWTKGTVIGSVSLR